MRTKQTPPATLAHYADMADRCEATALAALLRACQLEQPLPHCTSLATQIEEI